MSETKQEQQADDTLPDDYDHTEALLRALRMDLLNRAAFDSVRALDSLRAEVERLRAGQWPSEEQIKDACRVVESVPPADGVSDDTKFIHTAAVNMASFRLFTHLFRPAPTQEQTDEQNT